MKLSNGFRKFMRRLLLWRHSGIREVFLTGHEGFICSVPSCTGDLGRQIINYKESEAAGGRAVRGRQVLLIFDHYFKTNEEAGSLYSVEDLLKVQVVSEDLSTFIHNWESFFDNSGVPVS